MNTYLVTLGKSENQNHTYDSQFESLQRSSSKRWAIETKLIHEANTDVTHSINSILGLTIPKSEIGINSRAYVKTALHNPYIPRGFVGGDTITTARNQKVVVSYLLKIDKILKIYLEEHSDKDCFTIITDQAYSSFSLELSDVYWELFDRFQKIGSSYTFEFEHFSESEVPSRIDRMKNVYLRGH